MAEAALAPEQQEDGDIYKEPVKRIIKPSNQVELTPDELKEEVTRVLTADDPNRPKNVVAYSFKDQCFKLEPPGLTDHMAIHYSLEGCSLYVESEEYKTQKELEDRKKEEEEQKHKAYTNDMGIRADIVIPTEKKKNLFNFSERSTQTLNNALKDQSVETEPPPVAQYSANVSQWQIYDCYVRELLLTNNLDHAYHLGQQERSSTTGIAPTKQQETTKMEDFLMVGGREEVEDNLGLRSELMMKEIKIVERIVNQNSQDELYHDFKFWEDPSDQYKQGEGSLLPLWRFAYERTKMKQVTSLCWNPKNTDLFAVGYGSYNFLQQGSGLVCCYSIKNTSYPEYIFPTESGILALDFNPDHPSLLAVGCYDGNVHVYDVAKRSKKPIYSSNVSTGQHSDPVWQVHWDKEEKGRDINFYSVSSDGNVYNWNLIKDELKREPVIQLKHIPSVAGTNSIVEQATLYSGLASGCCFDFNRFHDDLFLVGTEEGSIYKCSKSYSGQYIESYKGHHMAVYTVSWNPFHEDIFISCSADWTVKLWDHKNRYPLINFDLGNSVGDVTWSLFSSTIFSAVTSDGKVHIYDLYENKKDPLCAQKIVKRAKLTKVRFNYDEYLLIVGDDKAGVNSFKLSPNLRKIHSTENPQVEGEDNINMKDVDPVQTQRKTIESVLSMYIVKPKI